MDPVLFTFLLLCVGILTVIYYTGKWFLGRFFRFIGAAFRGKL